MKKYFTLSALLIAGMTSAMAQNYSERVLINTTDGQYKGFLAERVESISFPVVEGRVAADVELLGINEEDYTINLNITRTEACEGFKIGVISKSDYNWYNRGDYMATYMDLNGSQTYYQNFTNANLSGVDLNPGSDYYVVTVGYDRYSIPCSVVAIPFSVPAMGLIGNPKVETTVTGTGLKEFSLHFSPNEDVFSYAFVAGEKGSIQSQYDMFAAWMGFTCFGDMVKGWGIIKDSEFDYTYTGMNPNTEYEVFVQAWDANGTYAECDTILVSTQAQGGSGTATVEVTLGAYELTDGWWDNETASYVSMPSQMITFTPNDQASCYRYGVVLAANYDADQDGWDNEIRQDPPMPSMLGWFQYDPLTTDFQINPGVDYVVITAAKNANDEWGPVQVNRFTTPQLDATYAPQRNIATRKLHKHTVKVGAQAGMVPTTLRNKTGIMLK